MNLRSALQNKAVFVTIYVLDMAIWIALGYYLGTVFK
jgi:hypothetical protein